jgi:hypothetical protein
MKDLDAKNRSMVESHGGEIVISLRPSLIRACGRQVSAAIILTRFIYWTNISEERDGWFYNTQKEIEEQTGIGEKSQSRVFVWLAKKGLLEQKYDRLNHTKWFRVNLKVFAEWMTKEMEKKPSAKKGNPHSSSRGVPALVTRSRTDTNSLSKCKTPKTALQKSNRGLSRDTIAQDEDDLDAMRSHEVAQGLRESQNFPPADDLYED